MISPVPCRAMPSVCMVCRKTMRRCGTETVRCLYAYTDFTGRNILPVLDGLADWLEAAAVDGKSVREVLGEDIESFCSALASGEGLKTSRDRWREQLNRSVKKRLGGSL